MTTKKAFLETYRSLLPERQPWATDQAKLDRFMDKVAASIGYGGTGGQWTASDQPTAREAFRKAGCKGPFTMSALRTLPHG